MRAASFAPIRGIASSWPAVAERTAEAEPKCSNTAAVSFGPRPGTSARAR